MDTAETSTVAAALTVKPAVNSRNALIAVAATVVVGAAVVGVVKWRKARAKTDEIVETETV